MTPLKINIIFLYAEINSYNIAVFKSLIKLNNNINIYVINWDKKLKSQYSINVEYKEIHFISKSKLSKLGILKTLISKQPQIIYISGWMDKDYIYAIRKYSKLNRVCKVVMGTDGQWHGSIRQHLGSLYFKVFLKNIYNYAWVPGRLQYEYVRRLGFPHLNIINNLLSADTELFHSTSNLNRRLLYVGRLSKEKGVDRLVNYYSTLPSEVKLKWPLIIIGDGPLRAKIEAIKEDNIILLGYLQDKTLLDEVQKGGIYISSSIHEQWGVSIHEMALLGYPLLLSNVCGAASEFIIENYNGYLYDINIQESFTSALLKIITLEYTDLQLFSLRSQILGNKINSELAAASLLSILYK